MADASTVLVVDDEPDVVDLVRFNLQRAGFKTSIATDGLSALRMAKEQRPDAMVLDIMLPGKDGIQVCRELKADPDTAGIAILMLTAKGQTADRIQGLETGADDYLTKPFSPRELILRIRSLLRRASAAPDGATLEVGPIRVNKGGFEAGLSGKKLDLTTTEFKLLCVLMERRGRVQSRETLLFDVWGYRNMIDTRTVDTHMRRLREKLGGAAGWLETVRGEGYRFRAVE